MLRLSRRQPAAGSRILLPGGNHPAAEFLWRSRSGSTSASLPLTSAKCTGSRTAAQATASPACSGLGSHQGVPRDGRQHLKSSRQWSCVNGVPHGRRSSRWSFPVIGTFLMRSSTAFETSFAGPSVPIADGDETSGASVGVRMTHLRFIPAQTLPSWVKLRMRRRGCSITRLPRTDLNRRFQNVSNQDRTRGKD